MAKANDWGLDPLEHGRANDPGSGVILPTHVKKIMPRIPFDHCKTLQMKLDKSCIVNAKQCKPTVAKEIDHSNFINIVCKNGVWPEFVAHGQMVNVRVRNGSPDQLEVIEIDY